MKLRTEQSEAIRRFIKNILCEASVDERDLAFQIEPWISEPTTYRLINTNQTLTDEHARVLLHGLTRFTDLDPHLVWQAMEDPFNLVLLPITELMECQCIRIDREEVSKLESSVAKAVAESSDIAIYDRTLPLLFVEEEVANRVVENRVNEFASDPSGANTLLRDLSQRVRDAFMINPLVKTLPNIRVIAVLSGLARLAKQRFPFANCAPDDIEASFASLINDTVLEKRASLSVLDDQSPGPARIWAWRRAKFASVAIFSSGLVVKRKRGTMAVRMFSAGYSAVSQKLYDDDCRDFAEAESLACHGRPIDKTVDFLHAFLKSMGREIFERPSMN